MKSQTLLTLGASVVIMGAVAGTGATVSAKSNTSTSTSTSHHNRADHKAKLEARLNQAVRDGTITDTQKKAFTKELKTLKTERKSAINKSSTPEQRKAERDKIKTELKAWASTNHFPLDKVEPRAAK